MIGLKELGKMMIDLVVLTAFASAILIWAGYKTGIIYSF